MSRFPSWFGAAVALIASGLGITGCQGLHRQSVPPASHAADADPSADHEPGPDTPLDVKSPTPKPFFKSSRLPGALSDEGREIERDLGIR